MVYEKKTRRKYIKFQDIKHKIYYNLKKGV